MTQYDYREAVKNDILDYLKNHDVGYIDDDLRQELEDDMFVDDSVTGNGSGSYTFNSWQAEENLCHNWDLLGECAEHFGIEDAGFGNAEYWDSNIRCYLLNQVFSEIIDDWNDEHPEVDDEDEAEED